MFNHVPTDPGAFVTFGRECVELTAADLDERKFRGHEKTIQRNECDDCSPLPKENNGRVPMLRDRFSQRHHHEK